MLELAGLLHGIGKLRLPDEIMEILNEQVDNGKLDRDVVMCVDHHLQDCWKVALSPHKH
jgi:response regulator RpfG family c-di-GMP phosphodiesterase